MRRLLIDTNLLCLFVVGSIGREWIAKHKRLRAYSIDDFKLLSDLISRFGGVVVTPHILTETSNLIRQAPEPLAALAGRGLARFIASVDELYRPAIEIIANKSYERLGLADAGALDENYDNVLVSDDLDLYLASQTAGLRSVNFNHLREAGIVAIPTG